MFNPNMLHVDEAAFAAMVEEFNENPLRRARYEAIIESNPDEAIEERFGSFDMLWGYFERIVGSDFEYDHDRAEPFNNNIIARLVFQTVKTAARRYVETTRLDVVPDSTLWAGLKTLLSGNTYSEILNPEDAQQIGLEFEGNRTFERNWRGRAYKLALHIICELLRWNPFYVFNTDLFADFEPSDYRPVIPPNAWVSINSAYPEYASYVRARAEMGYAIIDF